MEALSTTDRYFGEISAYQLLDDATRYELAKRVKNGDKVARDKMITTNLRLVISRAKFFCRRRGWSLGDLIGAGNIGLIKAVDGYDPEKTYLNEKTGKLEKIKFSPYATKTIDGYILGYIKHNQPLHVDIESQGKTVKVKIFIDKFYAQYGHEPDMEKIKEKFEYSDNDIEHIDAQLNLRFVSIDSPLKRYNYTKSYITQWKDDNNISPVALIEVKQKFEYLVNAQQQIRDYVDKEASTAQAMLLREFYSILEVIDPKKRPTLTELGLKMNLKHTNICHVGLRVIDKFARQFKLDRETLMNLAGIIEEVKIFLEDFYRR